MVNVVSKKLAVSHLADPKVLKEIPLGLFS